MRKLFKQDVSDLSEWHAAVSLVLSCLVLSCLVYLAFAGIVVPLIQMPGVEGSWARISAQIYNERGDYEKLAEAVLMLQTEEPPPQAAS